MGFCSGRKPVISHLGILVLIMSLVPSVLLRGLTVEDMIKIHRLGDPVLSPDLEHYVYTERKYLDGSDASEGYLVYSSINDPNNHVKICPNIAPSKGNPTFVNQRILLFTGILGGETNQAWQVDLEGDLNVCTQVTSYPISIDNLIVANSNPMRLLFSAEVYYGMTLAQTKEEEVKRANGPVYQHFRDGYVRHWDTWYEQDKWVHTFSTVMNFDQNGFVMPIVEEPVDITATVMGDVPMRPFGDRSQLSVSPDGSKVAYVTQDTNRVNKPNMSNPSSRQWTTNDAIYIINIDGTGTPDCITCDPKTYIYSEARASSPKWLEDNQIYFLGMKESESESDRVRLVRCDLPVAGSQTATNTFTFLTEDYDFSIGSFERDRLDKSVFWLTVSQRARYRIVRFDSRLSSTPIDSFKPVSTNRYTIVTPDGSSSSPQQTGDGRIIFGHNSYTTPSDVYILRESEISTTSTPEITCLTHSKETGIPLDVCMQPTQEFDMEVDGERIQSFYFLPCDFDVANPPAEKPPIILYVHGGPESPWDDGWSYRWNPQVILGQGYSMVLTNFHGSDSFGSKFTKSIRKNWFGDPFRDVVNGLKWMVEKGYGDPNRIGAMGASYGGTFMNWLNGHNDPLAEPWVGANGVQYNALTVSVIVTHDGIFDVRAFGYDTEETFFPAREFGGYPEDKTMRQYYDRDNPADFSFGWRTPTLVIQGGFDFRIAPNHGISIFQTLRMLGVESQFLYFPTQSHWVYSTQESVVWHNTVISWLNSHLQQPSN